MARIVIVATAVEVNVRRRSSRASSRSRFAYPRQPATRPMTNASKTTSNAMPYPAPSARNSTFASTSIARSTSSALQRPPRSGERSGTATGKRRHDRVLEQLRRACPFTAAPARCSRSAVLSLSAAGVAGGDGRITHEGLSETWSASRGPGTVAKTGAHGQSEWFRRYSSSPPKPPVVRPVPRPL